MIPREPPRTPQLGFLYLPPYRVQGFSVAGEQTAVQIPELDICFDIGLCPRPALASPFVALTHGHMDHAAGLAYYFSQRQFQGMGVGTIICHRDLEKPIHNVMTAWVDLECQRTPYKVVPVDPEGEVQLKNNVILRAFSTVHTPRSLGYVVLERRSKLLPELDGQPQEKIVQMKKNGHPITQTLEIPMVCFTGDTMWGDLFDRPDVLNAKILITECTFFEPEHRDLAGVGKHLHLDDIINLLDRTKAEAVVLTHLSRRSNLATVRQQLDDRIPEEQRHRLYVLMDQRANRARYEQQTQACEND